jgi:protoporphyrinogen oxidase
MKARVAVLGAGVAGLTAGRELARRGLEVHVYERWPGLGGQAATLDVGGGLELERYYHHLFTSDGHIAGLYEELGLPDGIEWLPSSVAFFINGRSLPFTTPMDLLRFSPLSPLARIRMGLAVLRLQRGQTGVGPYEHITARDWILEAMGPQAWEKVMGPLLRGKFGRRSEDISMAWLWSKFTLRRQISGRQPTGEVLGYPRGGFEPLFGALRDAIERDGGRVLIDRPAAQLERFGAGFALTPGASRSYRAGHDPRDFPRDGEPERYDAVLATVPSPVFDGLLAGGLRAEVGEAYLDRLRGIEYHAAQCLVLEMDRRFSPFYWTNVADSGMPFVGLIEQANLTGTERYDGRRFLYVANYVAGDDPVLERTADELLDLYTPGLQRVNPAFDHSWVKQRWLFVEPHAQPIVTPGYRERMPALETGAPGLVLANTTQVYPEDRGTNYAVRLGRQAAGVIADGLPGA